jgi:CheY-like chemotaxis protein
MDREIISLPPVSPNHLFSQASAVYSVDVILLVEDEAITRNAFADALQMEGHQVIQAADGEQALSLLNKYQVDLVITDLVMPRLNGCELIGQIRSKSRHIPILLISAYLSQGGGKIIFDGNAEFMRKPIDPPNLIATVQRLLPNAH